MAKIPDIIPITDLRQDAAAALKLVKGSKQPVVITQRGRAAAILLSTETYERRENENQLLRLIARGEQEIAAGKGYDLDTVLAEADALLAPKQARLKVKRGRPLLRLPVAPARVFLVGEHHYSTH